MLSRKRRSYINNVNPAYAHTSSRPLSITPLPNPPRSSSTPPPTDNMEYEEIQIYEYPQMIGNDHSL